MRDKLLAGPLDGNLDPFAKPTRSIGSRRFDADPESLERGLAQLVLTVVELLRQLMERQALRRVDAGGLTVLVVAEGSRTGLTWLPRAKQFWIGPRWSPADMPPPFVADAQLGPLEVPELTAERPPTIRNLADLPLHEGRLDRLAYATRDLRDMGSDKLVLAEDAMPPDSHNTDLHFHSAREEAWYVLSGGGTARLGDDGHPLSAGSFWLRRENTGVGHRIEVGPDGMQLVTMGDLIPGDVCVYPQKGTFKPARGVELPY